MSRTDSCLHCGAELEERSLFCGTCGRSTTTAPPSGARMPARATAFLPALVEPPAAERARPPVESLAAAVLAAPSAPDTGDLGAADADGPVDIETATGSGSGVPRFVLQFSTGESVSVGGEGLIGRGPVREPGEAVDQLIALADAGRSVSKTHLGFGQDRGRFWVSDRYSTNGTVLRPPDEPARRCEPGRRYLVARGTRVDIGDQFFVVS